jgi:hypothetical protein
MAGGGLELGYSQRFTSVRDRARNPDGPRRRESGLAIGDLDQRPITDQTCADQRPVLIDGAVEPHVLINDLARSTTCTDRRPVLINDLLY